MNGTPTLYTQLVHASPGRLRLRVRQEDLGSPTLRHAEQSLAALPGVRTVQLNPLARSVVLLYDESATDSSELIAAMGRSDIRVTPESERSSGGLGSRPLKDSIESAISYADNQVHEKSGGFVDLRTLVPIGLAAFAVRELLAGRLAAAPWYVLLWYSYSSYVNHRRQAERPRGRLDG